MAALARSAFVVLALAALAHAQIPSLGWCPDYVPMADFNMERYLGTWYEAERYFSVLEAGSRCVNTNYTKAVDGRVLVSNQITNRLTGIKRVVEGEIRNVVKGSESKLNIKYSTLPVPFETTYSVLDTDYDSYAVVWSCSSIGPLRTQSAWVMTRERLAPGTVLQMAYGVLDKYKISRTFFVKTDQADCAIAEAAAEAEQRRQQEASHGKSAVPITGDVSKPVEPVAPAVPVAPVVPVVAPVVPAVKSDIPVAPVEQSPVPAVPVAAADPIAPVQPAAPIAPVVPAAPVIPAAPVVEPVPSAVKSVQPEVPLPIAVANAAAAAAPAVQAAPAAAAVPAVPIAPAATPVATPITTPIAAPAAPAVAAAATPVAQQPVATPVDVTPNKVQ